MTWSVLPTPVTIRLASENRESNTNNNNIESNDNNIESNNNNIESSNNNNNNKANNVHVVRDNHPSALYAGDGDEVDESEW
mmetsp:Transcript_32631/g.33280  ORF Transcript_32631/g.33280 Transcript_32631/m.33280 type:complete len:81 (+) Transcript_32631:196-438(+)